MPVDRNRATTAAKLVLGTAQFGFDYGATNRRGQVPAEEVAAILATAHAAGIRMLDTAPGYGDSEAVVGRCLAGYPDFAVTSKTPVFAHDSITAADVERLRTSLRQSLTLLGRRQIDVLLLHHGLDLQKPGGELLGAALRQAKSEGLARRVGVSVYDAAELDAVLAHFAPDLVQLPLNLFDQRLWRSGHIARLRDAGIVVQARSVFLQGILLSRPGKGPRYFDGFAPAFERYFAALAETGLSPLAACLGFALDVAGIDNLVVGVTGCDELRQILAALAILSKPFPDLRRLASDDLALIDPRRWRIAEGATA